MRVFELDDPYKDNRWLKQLSMPVLDVQLYRPGAKSASNARQQYQDRVDALELKDNYRVLFYENTPHFLMEDRPELLDALVAAFVDGEDNYPGAEKVAPNVER